MKLFLLSVAASATSTTAFINPHNKAFTSVPQVKTTKPITTWETASDALPRVERHGLKLTNPLDLYWMVDCLKTTYYDNHNHYYPIKTQCNGTAIDVSFYCPFMPRISPHFKPLMESRDERMTIYDTTQHKYNRINSEKTSSLCTPSSSFEDTEIVALFYSMMYYINDQTAHLKLPEEEIQEEQVEVLNYDILIYLNEFLAIFEPHSDEDFIRIWDYLEMYQSRFHKVGKKIVLKEKYQGTHIPAQMPLIKRICAYLSGNFASKNMTQVLWEIIRYIKGVNEEIKIRGDKEFNINIKRGEYESGFNITLKEYDDFRDKVTASPMAHAVSDLTHAHFSYDAYMNPSFMELENRCSEIITYFNDVCTCQREMDDNDPFNSVFILMRDDDSLSFADSCDIVVKHAEAKMEAFLSLKEELLAAAQDKHERLALERMIKTREDSLIGYVLHEVCCVEDGYARDHKPLMKTFMEKEVVAFLRGEVRK